MGERQPHLCSRDVHATPTSVFLLYGKDAISNIDWRLVKTTGWLYLVALLIYAGFHIMKAAWKSDVDRQQEITAAKVAFERMVVEKDADYAAIVNMKDGEFKAAKTQSAEAYRHMEVVKDKEREAIERTLKRYTVVWRELQSKTHDLATELRVYAELTGPEPTPPLIAGESEKDFLERQLRLMQPWMEKVIYEYNKTFGDRVQNLRDEFAMLDYRDSKLDYRINTAVVHTDQVMEIADRLMGLALSELAKRQLRKMTLKQLCCD